MTRFDQLSQPVFCDAGSFIGTIVSARRNGRVTGGAGIRMRPRHTAITRDTGSHELRGIVVELPTKSSFQLAVDERKNSPMKEERNGKLMVLFLRSEEHTSEL